MSMGFQTQKMLCTCSENGDSPKKGVLGTIQSQATQCGHVLFDLGDGGRDLAHPGHRQLLDGDHGLELGAHRLQDRVQLNLLIINKIKNNNIDFTFYQGFISAPTSC